MDAGSLNSASEYDGLYMNAGSVPRMYFLRNGEFFMFRRKYDASIPLQYYYERDGIYTFEPHAEGFDLSWGHQVSVRREAGQVRAFRISSWAECIRINSVKEILEINSWQVRPLLECLSDEHGLSVDTVKQYILREDLFETLRFDFKLRPSISVFEMMLNYRDGFLNESELIRDEKLYEGFYGRRGGSANDFYIFKDGLIKSYRLPRAHDTKIYELVFKYNVMASSSEEIEVKQHHFSYDLERRKGQFLIKNGEVTGLRLAYSDYEKIGTMEELFKLRDLDARALMHYLISEHQMDADIAKSIIRNRGIINIFDPKCDKDFKLLDLVMP